MFCKALQKSFNFTLLQKKNILSQFNYSVLASTPTIFPKSKYDDLQQQAFNKENCILVDTNDKCIGSSSKKDCHLVSTSGSVKLHRGFSVFLFNTDGDMVMQKRSSRKITFPDTYTNACCSHPLYDIEGEREELNAIGVRRAAQRRLNYELGIPTDQLPVEDFHYLTRIRYLSVGDGLWGEHEIDYILFLQKNVDIDPNPNEVSEVTFLKRKEFYEKAALFDAPLTPWFKLIMKHHLNIWWDNLHQLQKCDDHKNIHNYV